MTAPLRKTLTPTNTALMQQAMQARPCSYDDLVAVSGLSKPLVTRYVRELYEGDLKMVHVGDWGRDPRGYPTIRKFKWGNKEDIPCPRKWDSDAERMKDARLRKKESQ